MKSSNLNQLIPQAMEAVRSSRMNEYIKTEGKDKGKTFKEIPSAMKGYIPAMGASIKQSGVLPTLAFYANDSGKEADSKKLLAAILSLISSQKERQNLDPTVEVPLVNYVITRCKISNTDRTQLGADNLNPFELNIVTKEILQALVALKLAVRTFKIEEK